MSYHETTVQKGEISFIMKTMVLDIGGTAIKSAIFENDHLYDIRETPTQASLGGTHVMTTAQEVISSYKEQYDFSDIGISTAGQVDPVKGRIIYANKNIPGYTGTPIREIMESAFQVPVYVENDVNAAALGEAVYGAGRGESDFVCLTYGTGVGGAMFTNGKLYHGSSCSAGEFGAMIIHPEDGYPEIDMFSGCYEKYASTTALISQAKAFDPAITNGKQLFSRFEEPDIRQLIDYWIQEIVYGLVSITHMLNPSCIILGGGIMEQPYIPARIEELLLPSVMSSFRHVKIKKATLGNQAGMLGASTLKNMDSTTKGGIDFGR